jgi:hypothetical protein
VADQELVQEPALEGADAPVIEAEAQQEADRLEQIAAKHGWSPKEQWKGDPEAWKPADAFIETTFDINKGFKRTIKGFEEQLAGVARATSTLMEDRLKERDDFWRTKHREAVEAGDVEAAEEALTERGKVQTQVQEAARAAPPREAADFVERHASWWNKDIAATERAQELCDRFAKRGFSVGEQLTETERVLKKEYPELFPAAAKPQAQVSAPGSRTATTSNRAKGWNDIPAESRKILSEFGEKHSIPEAKLAESFWKQQEKVG